MKYILDLQEVEVHHQADLLHLDPIHQDHIHMDHFHMGIIHIILLLREELLL